jgi:hypothetical protein
MKKCVECGSAMQQLKAKTPEGIEYNYYKCGKDGEEIVDMKQLHEVAEHYRALKKYNVKLSKWGLSLGLRIPKELVQKYKLKNEKEVSIIPEKSGLRILTS